MVLYHDYHDSCSYHITHMPVCPTQTNRGVNNSINFFPPEQIAATDCSGRCALVLGKIYQILFSKYIKCTNYQNIRTNIFKDIFLLGGWWIAMFWVIGRANQTDSDALLQSPDGQHSTTSHIFCFCGHFHDVKVFTIVTVGKCEVYQYWKSVCKLQVQEISRSGQTKEKRKILRRLKQKSL